MPPPKGGTGLSSRGTIGLVQACGARLVVRLAGAKPAELFALLHSFRGPRPKSGLVATLAKTSPPCRGDVPLSPYPPGGRR